MNFIYQSSLQIYWYYFYAWQTVIEDVYASHDFISCDCFTKQFDNLYMGICLRLGIWEILSSQKEKTQINKIMVLRLLLSNFFVCIMCVDYLWEGVKCGYKGKGGKNICLCIPTQQQKQVKIQLFPKLIYIFICICWLCSISLLHQCQLLHIHR